MIVQTLIIKLYKIETFSGHEAPIGYEMKQNTSQNDHSPGESGSNLRHKGSDKSCYTANVHHSSKLEAKSLSEHNSSRHVLTALL